MQMSIGEFVIIGQPISHRSSAHRHMHVQLSVLLCCCMTLSLFQQTSLFIFDYECYYLGNKQYNSP